MEMWIGLGIRCSEGGCDGVVIRYKEHLVRWILMELWGNTMVSAICLKNSNKKEKVLLAKCKLLKFGGMFEIFS
jgi:hypothetical protein